MTANQLDKPIWDSVSDSVLVSVWVFVEDSVRVSVWNSVLTSVETKLQMYDL
jgi:hypothetical protein